MQNIVEDNKVFLFLSNIKENEYYCRSFFPEETMDYTKNQASWTLLYKKKISVDTGNEMVLYDRLSLGDK